eukprot:CAMPEP_0117572766 /NCGR_PEP_ID=MMETSP0784-20121206/60537_1 /TAXON_ID=39447 /ORGANISM="" /LENGTH=437 /DNA_ID=CAMNT_0005371169 /DNA_START=26 /DNA_END=1336 /DNA_ORIENTATION=-
MAGGVDIGRRPATFHKVDPQELLGEEGAPPVNPQTGLPTALRAYTVLREPRMTVLPNFLSDDECDHLIRLVDGYWMPSLVGQGKSLSEEQYARGELENAVSKTRTSWSCMLRYAQTAVVERLEHRVASVAGLPLEQLERMNMVRYAPGEHFDEHHDGVFRPRTVFVYLNDLPEDDDEGDTSFPALGLSFKPRKGAAVMWSNVADGTDREDGRMLHMGRAPTKGVKYGVNCFFNVKQMRLFVATSPNVALDEAVVVDTADLHDGHGGGGSATDEQDAGVKQSVVKTGYCLCKDPKLVCVPRLIDADEFAHLTTYLEASVLDLGELGYSPGTLQGGPFMGGTQTLRLLEIGATPVLEALEARIAGAAGLPLEHLARLRLVRPGVVTGLCNRGCGPKSAYVCLSEEDEVFFPALGIRLLLRRGDAVLWPNVDWETGSARE